MEELKKMVEELEEIKDENTAIVSKLQKIGKKS